MKDLPMPINEIIKGVDAVIATHIHEDHWDKDAAKNIPTNIPIFVQNESDKKEVQNQGFKDVTIVDIDTPFKGITITKSEGKHGTDDVIEHFGKGCEICMGFTLRAPEEKTIYFTGDTIWTKNFETTVEKYEPDYIVMNAALPSYDGVEGTSTMGQDDVKKCCDMYKKPKIIVTHLDSLAHCTCTTETMKKFVEENKISDRVIIPKDGETVTL